MAMMLKRGIPFLIVLAGLAGCRETTIIHRESSEAAGLNRGVSLRHADSVSAVPDRQTKLLIAERDLSSPADTSLAWKPDSAGARVFIPVVEATKTFDFEITPSRILAPGDSFVFSGSIPDTLLPDMRRPLVRINRWERMDEFPISHPVHPGSISISLLGIPSDTTFQPALPPGSRITARKAMRYRLEFDGWILEGETQVVEYRYVSTTEDIENDGFL
jgi:hypothetical protein